MPGTDSGKSIPGILVRYAGRVLNVIRIARSGLAMRRCDRRRKESGPVRVGFVAQMPEVWDKQLSLFQLMSADARFAPEILYVNHYDYSTGRISEKSDADRRFYEDLYGPDKVRAYSGDPAELDRFDVLFYDRPFNHYLPKDLQTSRAMRHARLCMINYGSDDWEMPFVYTEFAMGIRMWFASNTHEYDLHRSVFGNSRFHRAYDVGYPAYAYYHSLASLPGKNRILWTPRWSYDAEVGGSHFFEYIEQMIAFAAGHDVSLVIRPHPLMFENLIREKRITEEEVQHLKRRCAEAGIRFDEHRIVADTFRETDILVSDYSSILGPYLATCKPVIYCPSGIPLNAEFQKLVDTMYAAVSWPEIEETLLRLLAGEDPLREKRQEAVSGSLLGKSDAAKAIADIVWQDHTA